MKIRNVFLGVSLVIVGAALIYLGANYLSGRRSSPQVKATASSVERFAEQGDVSIEVKPIKIEPRGQSQFALSLNTHSVELVDDLKAQTVLYNDQSHYFKPLNWEGSPPGGHHRQGVLTFGPLDDETKYVELKIKDIGETPVSIFRWDLK